MANEIYRRAVQLAEARPSLSVTNLKTALRVTDAVARSILGVMVRERILSDEPNAIGRHAVLTYNGPAMGGDVVVNLDDPELSQIPALVVADQVLDARGQAELKRVIAAFIDIENRMAALRDEAGAVRGLAKVHKISPKIAQKVAKALFKGQKAELIDGINLTELYLHALGEMVDGEPSDTVHDGSVH